MAERSLAPDTYRKLAHALNESLEDALMSIESYDEMMRIREWADRELRPRLRALDEAGPYGWVAQEHSGGKWRGGHVVMRAHVEELRETTRGLVRFNAERGIRTRHRIVPLYAGTPEEVEDE